jgi:tetrahydromethanopterin S-methyltransferase subunit G
MPVVDDSRRIDELERKVHNLEQRLDELTRLLKRANDEAVQRAARRTQ